MGGSGRVVGVGGCWLGGVGLRWTGLGGWRVWAELAELAADVAGLASWASWLGWLLGADWVGQAGHEWDAWLSGEGCVTRWFGLGWAELGAG